MYRKKALPLGLVRAILKGEQRKMVHAFMRHFPPTPTLRVLDLGVTGAHTNRELYTFQNTYPYPRNTTACGLEDGAIFASVFPEIPYVTVSRGKSLPFDDNSFDVVHCAAVVEHVGDRNSQRAFIAEALRVAKAAFFTTPNRWYPIELHTVLPFIHYLPRDPRQRIMRSLGFEFFADEANLNLLTRRELRELVPSGRSAFIESHYFLGLPSNLLLVIPA
jgi:SAM-dependent methyltransferase